MNNYMDKETFSDTYELAVEMLENLGVCEDTETVACIANYDIISELLSAITVLTQGEIKYLDVNLSDLNMTGYDREYELILDSSGVSVYPLYNEEFDDYFELYDDLVYIHEDCNSRILFSNCNADSEYVEFVIEPSCCCDECSEHCKNETDGLNAIYKDLSENVSDIENRIKNCIETLDFIKYMLD